MSITYTDQELSNENFVTRDEFNTMEKTSVPLGTQFGIVGLIQEEDVSMDIKNKLALASNALPKPTNDSSGTVGQFLKKTAAGSSEWSDVQEYLDLSDDSGTLTDEQYNKVTTNDTLIIRRSSIEYRLQSKPLNGSGNYNYISTYYATGDAAEFAAYIIVVKTDKTWSWTTKSFSTGGGSAQAVVLSNPASATNGTLTADQLALLQADDSNYIEFNNELYYLADKQHTTGVLSYTHSGWNGSVMMEKSINITISSLAWTLYQGCTKYYRHHITFTTDGGAKTFYYDFSSASEDAYTATNLPVMPDTVMSPLVILTGGYYSTVCGVVYRNSASELKVIAYGMYTSNGTSTTYLSLLGADVTFVSDEVLEQ